ncbi:MAG: hypothetical protein V9E94_07940 [Microthrixaceae bacterium]
MIRIFLERLIEWDWPDAPSRNPILHGDIPPRPEPLPKFLTDHQAATFMAAARAHPLPRYRIVAEILARTGHARQRALRPRRRRRHASSVTPTGSGSPSASSATTGSSRCTPTSSPSSPTGPPPTATTSAPNGRLIADDHAPIDRRTVHRIVATHRHAPPASATSTPTSSATPSPPKPSTAACASKPSPRSSATAPWR